MDLEKVRYDVEELVVQSGWIINSTKIATTGSIYVEIVRNRDSEREWVVVRVANHKQVYHRWLITYSISPGDMWFEELEEVLLKPFGSVGDVL